jgi:DUF2892 family protein
VVAITVSNDSHFQKNNISLTANRNAPEAPLLPCDYAQRKDVSMLYTKNLAGWERILRSVAGLAMGACGLLGPGLAGTPVGYIIAASGVVTLLTGFVGYCPACAMAGRELR